MSWLLRTFLATLLTNATFLSNQDRSIASFGNTTLAILNVLTCAKFFYISFIHKGHALLKIWRIFLDHAHMILLWYIFEILEILRNTRILTIQ